ncbi:MAG: antibiotic biosynthesis monooxygenase family protein [Alphaproteobacteria bacterium]|nr:antibiotic biosynthesis monooxygenase family protein [Alphaproteobacteria bacterium]
MISLIVTVRAKPGMEKEYERIAGTFSRHVEANRPGCLLFRTYRTDDPREFITIEHFEDEAALKAHQAHAETKERLEELRSVLDGNLQARIFTESEAV